MLKRLGESMQRWAPSRHDGTSDPLVLLRADWPEIAGEELARCSQPAAIVPDAALVIVTRSSAWSQQLSFLSEQLLAAIRARVPAAGIERLRFRVGKVAAPSLGGPGQRRGYGRRGKAAREPVGEREPAATAEEAVARFRADVDARRRAKRSAGWKECEGCGALIAPHGSTACSRCENARAQERSNAAARLLFEAPWLGFAGTAELVDGLGEEEYSAIRARLLARWWEMLVRARAAKRLSRDGHERLIASSYILLKSQLSPEAIVPATVRSMLGDELHDLIYGEPGREVQRS